MKVISNLPTIINAAFNYVIDTSIKYNIDESHSLKHSMEVFKYANEIYANEKLNYPIIEDQKDIIVVSAIVHDMCDKKYMSENFGVENIKEYFRRFFPENKLNIIGDIISTMSYSKVKKNGYADLGDYQIAYHIVRESDLLSSYDIDRCIMYGMCKESLSYIESVSRAEYLFCNRVLNYIDDDLFFTEYSKNKSKQLELNAINNLKNIHGLKNIIN